MSKEVAEHGEIVEYIRVVSVKRREKEKMWPGLGDRSYPT
jgi:hypothetical protein